MSRYYKTARPQHIDYAFKLPTNLLAKVVQSQDMAIDKTYLDLEKMELSMARQKDTTSKLGKGMYLSGDEKANIETIKGFEDRIGEIGTKLQKDPFSYNTLQGDISDVRGDIRADFMYGRLGKQHENYSYVNQWRKDMKAAGVDDAYANRVLQQQIGEWDKTDYDAETGNYRNIKDYLPKSLFGETFQNVADEYGKQIKDRTSALNIQENIVKSMINDEDIIGIYNEQLKYGNVPKEYKAIESDTPEQILNKIESFARNEAGPVADRYYKPEKKTGSGSKKADYSKLRSIRTVSDGAGGTLNFDSAWPKDYNKAQQNSVKDNVANPELWKETEMYFQEGDTPLGIHKTIEDAQAAGVISLNPKDDRNVPDLKFSNMGLMEKQFIINYAMQRLEGSDRNTAMKWAEKNTKVDGEAVYNEVGDSYLESIITKWQLQNMNFNNNMNDYKSDGNTIQKIPTNYFKIDRTTIKPGYDTETGKTAFTFIATIGGEPHTMGIDADAAVEIENFGAMVANPKLRIGSREAQILDNPAIIKMVTTTSPQQYAENIPVWKLKDDKGYFYGLTSTATRGSVDQQSRTQALDKIKKGLK